jgi:hypothetical protein
MTGWRLARRIILTGAVVVAVPLFVIGASLAGLEPTHWSGVRLSGVELLPGYHRIVVAPEPANVLLSLAMDQDETGADDLAPSYWDPDAGQVVLGAATDAGVQQREALGRSSSIGYRVERRPHSSAELRGTMDRIEAGPWLREIRSLSVDSRYDRVVVEMSRLSHPTLATLRGYGDMIAVRLTPLQGPGYLDGPPPNAPSMWSEADPPGTWFTLLTGFPWYLGTVLALAAAAWALLLRRPRRVAPIPA